MGGKISVYKVIDNALWMYPARSRYSGVSYIKFDGCNIILYETNGAPASSELYTK